MQVTDKMIDAAIIAGGFDCRLTNDALRSDMRDALEAAIQAAWVKFDVDDKSTWPKLHKDVAIGHGFYAAFSGYTWYTDDYDLADQNVASWMPLP